MSQQSKPAGARENIPSIRRPQPHPTNQWKEEKEKILGDKKEEQKRPTRRHWLCSVKQTSTTPWNTGLLRSFHRDTERGTKVLRHWEILQRRGANERQWATNAIRLTCTAGSGTYGNGNASLIWCIGLHLILYSMHNTATDRRWARLYCNHREV